jgi:hypothetical protein
LVAGGSFTTVGGQSRVNLAAVNATNGAPMNWVHDTNDAVKTIASSATGIHVGGTFQRVSGAVQPFLGVLDMP